MTSLSARLTALYAASFFVASAGMLAIGYWQIDERLIRGTDRLIATEKRRVYNHLALGDRSVTSAALAAKLRRPTDNSATLFQIEVRDPAGRSLFRSANLSAPFALPAAGWNFAQTTLRNGEDVRVGRFDHGDAIVLIGTPFANVTAGMHAYVRMSLLLLAAMIGIGIALGYALSQVALRPLREIALTTSRIGSDNLAERLPESKTDDEVGGLAKLLNAMLDRIESSFRQIRQFTADASHELKTPLSLVRLHAEALLSGTRLDEDQENHVVAQLEQVDQIAAMIEDLLVLARADSSSMSLALAPHDPAAFLDGMAADAEVLAEASGGRVAMTHDGAGTAEFDARWVRRIIFNLLTNALRANPPGGTIRISSALGPADWTVAVSDEGSGVTTDQQQRMFDRFFTATEGGTGLGLAICRSIVSLHGGTIHAEAGPGGRGLTVLFGLPRVAAD